MQTTVTLEKGSATLVFKEISAQICDNYGEKYIEVPLINLRQKNYQHKLLTKQIENDYTKGATIWIYPLIKNTKE